MFSTNKRKTSRTPETLTNGEKKKKREPQTLIIRSFFVGKKKKGRVARERRRLWEE